MAWYSLREEDVFGIARREVKEKEMEGTLEDGEHCGRRTNRSSRVEPTSSYNNGSWV